MKLGRKMKQLNIIVYVSTAYSNCNRSDVEEKVYPLNGDVDSIIDQIIRNDNDDDDKKPEKGDPILFGRPNSYTASKAIAEYLIQEKFADLPIVICRPSIVAHAYDEPIKGWCDSLNGFSAPVMMGCLGILQTYNLNFHKLADIIPVDFVANSLIVIGYYSAIVPEKRKK
ncbi:hypothetical protein BLA29_011888, partial [Euroglyphus maynei]